MKDSAGHEIPACCVAAYWQRQDDGAERLLLRLPGWPMDDKTDTPVDEPKIPDIDPITFSTFISPETALNLAKFILRSVNGEQFHLYNGKEVKEWDVNGEPIL